MFPTIQSSSVRYPMKPHCTLHSSDLCHYTSVSNLLQSSIVRYPMFPTVLYNMQVCLTPCFQPILSSRCGTPMFHYLHSSVCLHRVFPTYTLQSSIVRNCPCFPCTLQYASVPYTMFPTIQSSV
ncbi:hypothetical protein CDAR_601711 [Caerostris darwini]|uniref:Uncharacterized protein n=1 Tax=Caerostris darwini TaxID=1538125 RepID=A0AAV4P5G9_9ARAC|nr:hypothetical protein CDAR_601711 [Caerostris darwini]